MLYPFRVVVYYWQLIRSLLKLYQLLVKLAIRDMAYPLFPMRHKMPDTMCQSNRKYELTVAILLDRLRLVQPYTERLEWYFG